MAESALDRLAEAVYAAAVNTRDAVLNGAQAISDSPGAAPLHAMVRQGAGELAQILPAFPDSNVRPVEEQGQIFNPTPAIVTAEMTGRDLDMGMDR